MSLVSNLLFNNFPPPPPRVPAAPLSKQEKAAQHPNHIGANLKRRNEALARYRKAMNGEWLKTREIAERLNAKRSSVQCILAEWYRAGLIEQRDWSQGYEWRLL